MKFQWLGINANETQSMGIVDRENILALESMGWERSESPDIVFSFMHQGPLEPDLSGRLRAFYICTTTHNSIIAENVDAMRRTSETKNNFIFVLNRQMQESFHTCGIKTHIWNHGVNLEHFKNSQTANEGPFSLGFVGQGAEWKRHGFLVKCFLDAFGDDGDIATLKLMTGWQHIDGHPDCDTVQLERCRLRVEMPEFLASLDGLVSFSYSEGFNMPPIEALACGTPVLVTDMPSMNETPYDELCEKVPSKQTIVPQVLLGERFAPKDISLYAVPPFVHEISHDDGVESLKRFVSKGHRRLAPLDDSFSWANRIKNQVFPIIEVKMR